MKKLSFKFILYIVDTQFRGKSVYPERFLVAVHRTAGSKSGNRLNLAGSLEAVWGITPIQPRSCFKDCLENYRGTAIPIVGWHSQPHIHEVFIVRRYL